QPLNVVLRIMMHLLELRQRVGDMLELLAGVFVGHGGLLSRPVPCYDPKHNGNETPAPCRLRAFMHTDDDAMSPESHRARNPTLPPGFSRRLAGRSPRLLRRPARLPGRTIERHLGGFRFLRSSDRRACRAGGLACSDGASRGRRQRTGAAL